MNVFRDLSNVSNIIAYIMVSCESVVISGTDLILGINGIITGLANYGGILRRAPKNHISIDFDPEKPPIAVYFS